MRAQEPPVYALASIQNCPKQTRVHALRPRGVGEFSRAYPLSRQGEVGIGDMRGKTATPPVMRDCAFNKHPLKLSTCRDFRYKL